MLMSDRSAWGFAHTAKSENVEKNPVFSPQANSNGLDSVTVSLKAKLCSTYNLFAKLKIDSKSHRLAHAEILVEIVPDNSSHSISPSSFWSISYHTVTVVSTVLPVPTCDTPSQSAVPPHTLLLHAQSDSSALESQAHSRLEF